jgi:hypothetical protein
VIWDAPTPPPKPGHGLDIAKAVAIAALSAAATGLVAWGIETLKKKATKEPPPEEKP